MPYNFITNTDDCCGEEDGQVDQRIKRSRPPLLLPPAKRPVPVPADAVVKILNMRQGVQSLATCDLGNKVRRCERRTERLEGGELVSGVAISENEHGGGILAVTPATAESPANVDIQVFDDEGGVMTDISMDGVAVTISPNLVVPGILQAGAVEDVEGSIVDLEGAVLRLEIADAANVAFDIAQAAAQAAMAAGVFPPKPDGFTPLDEVPDEFAPEYDPEDQSTSLQPLTLKPAGTFPPNPLQPEEIIRAHGQVGLNTHFPSASLHVVGSIRQVPDGDVGLVDFEGKVKLGSTQAKYDGQTLLNPNEVVAELGSNALVTVGGHIDAASLTVENSVICGEINAVNLLQTLHIAQRPQADVSRKLQRLGDRIADVQSAIKPHLSARYDRAIARLHDALGTLRSELKPTLAADSRRWLQRVLTTIMDVQRRIKPSLAPDLGRKIADLASRLRPAPAIAKPALAPDFSRKIAGVAARIRPSKPSLAPDLSRKIAGVAARIRPPRPAMSPDLRRWVVELIARVQNTLVVKTQAARGVDWSGRFNTLRAWVVSGAMTLSNKTLASPVVTGGMDVGGAAQADLRLNSGSLVLNTGWVTDPTNDSEGVFLNSRTYQNGAGAIYWARSGTIRTLMGGPTTAWGLNGNAIRLRVENNDSSGVIVENSAEQGLWSVEGLTGDVLQKGNLVVLGTASVFQGAVQTQGLTCTTLTASGASTLAAVGCTSLSTGDEGKLYNINNPYFATSTRYGRYYAGTGANLSMCVGGTSCSYGNVTSAERYRQPRVGGSGWLWECNSTNLAVTNTDLPMMALSAFTGGLFVKGGIAAEGNITSGASGTTNQVPTVSAAGTVIKSGTQLLGARAANAQVVISYDYTFTTAPVYVATLDDARSSTAITAHEFNGGSTTGFSIHFGTGGCTGNASVKWIAVGIGP